MLQILFHQLLEVLIPVEPGEVVLHPGLGLYILGVQFNGLFEVFQGLWLIPLVGVVCGYAVIGPGILRVLVNDFLEKVMDSS